MEGKGEGAFFSGHTLAARWNGDAICGMRRDLSKERNRVFKNPQLALARFSVSAEAKLASLERRADEAKASYDRASARKDSGELDEQTFYAETVSSRLIVVMHDFLQTLLGRAMDAKDIYAIRRSGVVAEKLTILAESLLKETRYTTEPTVRKELSEQSIGMARQAYDDAVLCLDEVYKGLGVRLAEFPARNCQ